MHKYQLHLSAVTKTRSRPEVTKQSLIHDMPKRISGGRPSTPQQQKQLSVMLSTAAPR